MEQRCLLIVEDEYWTRYKLVHQHRWEEMGISRVLEAENGECAIELMDREHVDYVITDMDMPYIDGGELAKWIQKNHPEISVIVLSGYSDFPTVHSALEGGVIDYLLKPASDFDLKKAIDKFTQEMDMRTSTQKEMERNRAHLLNLETTLLSKLERSGLDYIRNGGNNRIPGNMSLSFKNVEGEMLLHRLDLQKICISTGSACDSKNTQISHVIKAINVPSEYAKGTIRISFGKHNTIEEVEKIAGALIKIMK